MPTVRKPFEGVCHILRFNWHFYVLALVAVLGLFICQTYLPKPYNLLFLIIAFGVLLTTFVSILVSFYVYDCSSLYKFNWLNKLNIQTDNTLINIHAGFDETSELLKHKYPANTLYVLDFYNPKKHTEVSIKRARKYKPAFTGTIAVPTHQLPFESNTTDFIFLIFAAHEVRNNNERVAFLKELYRILKPDGKIVITEHLQDLPNFLAFNIGFLHFQTKQTWLSNFIDAGFTIKQHFKTTPLVHNFILTK